MTVKEIAETYVRPDKTIRRQTKQIATMASMHTVDLGIFGKQQNPTYIMSKN